MVRTKADNCSKKAVAAKAPRKVLGSSTNSSASSSGLSSPSSGKVGKYAGGNPVCDRPTPDWQKGISTFLKKLPEKENSVEKTDADNDEVECVTMEAVGASSQTSSSSVTDSSASQTKRNGIVDSDED